MQSCPVPPQFKRPFPDRVVAALRLDATVFEEVEHDEEAMGQAFWVVVLAALAQGLGAIQAPSIPSLIGALFGLSLVGILGWVIGTAVIWLIGVKLMQCTSDFAELMRTIGFASAPKILMMFGVLPMGWWGTMMLAILVSILSIVATVIAVRQALDVPTGRAVLVCVIAAIVGFAFAVTIGTLLGVGMGVMGGDAPEVPLPSSVPIPGQTPDGPEVLLGRLLGLA
jgi:hypothetical protein